MWQLLYWYPASAYPSAEHSLYARPWTWTRLCSGKLAWFLSCPASPRLPLDSFLCRQRPGSSKKGFPATWPQTSTFSCCWTPFCAVSGLDPPKRDSPQPNLRLRPFSAAGNLFVPSAAWILQKGVPRNLTSYFDLFLLLDPFLCGQRPGSSKTRKRGLVTWLQACFRSHLFSSLATQRRCTCVSSLCAAVVVWIYCLRATICGACPVYKGRLAQSVEREALNLKIMGSSSPWG